MASFGPEEGSSQMKSIKRLLLNINSGCALATVPILFFYGCNRADSVGDTVTDTNTDTITDTTEERRLMYEYDSELYYAPYPDGGEDTDGVEGYYVTQEEIEICPEAMCSESSMAMTECGYFPYLKLIIMFHEDYPLVGTHSYSPDDGIYPREVFRPMYYVGPGEWTYAESGTATVTKDGDDYVIEYEATMEDGSHFEDTIRPELCGFPVPED